MPTPTPDDPQAIALARRRMAEERARVEAATDLAARHKKAAAAAAAEAEDAEKVYGKYAAFFDGSSPLPAEQQSFDLPAGD